MKYATPSVAGALLAAALCAQEHGLHALVKGLGLQEAQQREQLAQRVLHARLIQRPEPRNMIRTMFLGKQAYDRSTTPGASIAGLQGPGGIQLYSPGSAVHQSALNTYLRYKAGIPPRIRETAILVTAREFDSQFEWSAHEGEGLKEGVPQAVIDVIKNGKGLDGLDPKDAIVIEFGRQLWRNHKVTPATFAKAKEIFGPNQLVEIVLLMSNYAGTAALLSAFDMQLHEGKTPGLPPR